MFPLQYHELISRTRRADLLAEAEHERTARASLGSSSAHTLRDSTLRVLCKLPVPALEPACAMVPA